MNLMTFAGTAPPDARPSRGEIPDLYDSGVVPAKDEARRESEAEAYAELPDLDRAMLAGWKRELPPKPPETFESRGDEIKRLNGLLAAIRKDASEAHAASKATQNAAYVVRTLLLGGGRPGDIGAAVNALLDKAERGQELAAGVAGEVPF